MAYKESPTSLPSLSHGTVSLFPALQAHSLCSLNTHLPFLPLLVHMWLFCRATELLHLPVLTHPPGAPTPVTPQELRGSLVWFLFPLLTMSLLLRPCMVITDFSSNYSPHKTVRAEDVSVCSTLNPMPKTVPGVY